MKLWSKRLLALCLAVCLLLGGCATPDLGEFWQSLQNAIHTGLATPFDEMVYTRPDPDDVVRQAAKAADLSKTDTDIDSLMEEVLTCYDIYYSFYTNYMLSNIRYCTDMTDIYWEEEYNYCLDAAAEVDAAMDSLLYELADCELREALEQDDFFGEDFFSAYEGDSLWDETFTALMDREAELLTKYYTLSAKAMAEESYTDAYFKKWGVQFENLFLELVLLRQEIAQYAGYENYLSFAYDFYYHRDYTPKEAADFLSEIRRELSGLYATIPGDVWDAGRKRSTESQTLSYVEGFSEKMGGTVADAFALLKDSKLYDISVSDKKYPASFEVYLPSYFTPYVFMDPRGTAEDKLTLAHEFGHFCSDYAASGSAAGIDVAEVFSQAMEFLSLRYSDNVEALEKMKLADSLSLMVEQTAYASFEHQLYAVTDESLTVEKIRSLYETIGKECGFESWGWDCRDYVMVPHFFTNPLYVVSYVVSNDAAMQIYEAELKTPGAGLAILEDSLATQQAYFLAYVEEAGLESPFRSGRAKELAEIFREGIW